MKFIDNKLKETNEIFHFCSHYKNIHLYGAGAMAHEVYDMLYHEGISLQDVIVSRGHRTKTTFCGLKIFELPETSFSEEDGIILALHPKNHVDIAEKILKEKDMSPFQIYGYTKGLFSQESKEGVKDSGIFFLNINELDTIGNRRGTDKGSNGHNYLNKYEYFLKSMKEDPITLLELGVYHGSSIRMWSDYFKKAKIYGVDINKECEQYKIPHCTILIKDLADEFVLKELGKLKPNIVIDDASHLWSHQIKALYHLLPAIPKGGIYILEDLQTSLDKRHYPGYNDTFISAYEFLSYIAQGVTSRGYLKEKIGVQKEIEELSAQIDMVCFIYGSCIIIK